MISDAETLTFDDVLLVPQLSDIRSRHDVSLKSGKLGLELPIISANMDTVTEENMAIEMARCGGMGIIHRFLDVQRLDQIIVRTKSCTKKFAISIGINEDSDELIEVAVKRKVDKFCIDVAHGHHGGVADRIALLKSRIPYDITIIAGNVGTPEGVVFLAEAGADIIKVGIGPGSHCTTRVVTGHGFPQLSAIIQCSDAAKDMRVEIIADGGIRNSGDIAKAIAAGANYVMIGRLLAGTNEAPGTIALNTNKEKIKVYRGMASREAQKDRGRSKDRIIAEGVRSSVPYSGPLSGTLGLLRGGMASALSYTGAHTVKEFQEKAKFIRVTHNSYIEGTPHGV